MKGKRRFFLCPECLVGEMGVRPPRCPKCNNPMQAHGGTNKYHATALVEDGRRFASKKEARRWRVLKQMQDMGLIHSLETQVTCKCEVNGVLICRYRADFRYFDLKTNEWVYEDAKGFKPDVYKLKKKLMLACNNINIKEV